MNHARKLTIMGIALVAAFMVVPSTAHAYIDPATGNILLQALLMTFVGVAIGAKFIWRNVKMIFSIMMPKKGNIDLDKD